MMISKRVKAIAIVISLSISNIALAATHDVGQKDKQFTVTKLKAKVGDKVKFINNDPFFHNVFSLSDTATFDLGSYPQGEFKVIELGSPGTVEVECAIHPSMKMVIEVR